jgi:hypothetical protein
MSGPASRLGLRVGGRNLASHSKGCRDSIARVSLALKRLALEEERRITSALWGVPPSSEQINLLATWVSRLAHAQAVRPLVGNEFQDTFLLRIMRQTSIDKVWFA